MSGGNLHIQQLKVFQYNITRPIHKFIKLPIPFPPGIQIHVSLAIYNISGQKVATLINGQMKAVKHSAQFDGLSLASVIYFYRFETGKFNKTGRMLLAK